MARQERQAELPRISVNKLGEYMVATPGRRRQIIRDQKDPKDFIVAYYAKAHDAITAYLCDESRDTASLVSVIDALNRTPASTAWEQTRNDVCAAAIESFLDVAEELDLGHVDYKAAENAPPHLMITGVSVSVRPEFLLTRIGSSRPDRGALKLAFCKNDPLGVEAGTYVGDLVQQYAEALVPGVAPVDRGLCLSLDVFARRLVEAPRAVVRRRRGIEVACEEIAYVWPFA